ncbi:unnamed protein product [Closterium sp. NIES-64]|nr:unnamed protein product [Closterium sp. NIES-64]
MLRHRTGSPATGTMNSRGCGKKDERGGGEGEVEREEETVFGGKGITRGFQAASAAVRSFFAPVLWAVSPEEVLQQQEEEAERNAQQQQQEQEKAARKALQQQEQKAERKALQQQQQQQQQEEEEEEETEKEEKKADRKVCVENSKEMPAFAAMGSFFAPVLWAVSPEEVLQQQQEEKAEQKASLQQEGIANRKVSAENPKLTAAAAAVHSFFAPVLWAIWAAWRASGDTWHTQRDSVRLIVFNAAVQLALDECIGSHQPPKLPTSGPSFIVAMAEAVSLAPPAALAAALRGVASRVAAELVACNELLEESMRGKAEVKLQQISKLLSEFTPALVAPELASSANLLREMLSQREREELAWMYERAAGPKHAALVKRVLGL